MRLHFAIGQFGLYHFGLDYRKMVTSLHHSRYAKLRSVLKEVRTNAGLTQVQLAARLHMEQSNLSKIERGERFVDTMLFIDFCKACDADPADVIRKVVSSSELAV